ncbi:MAG: PAS domain-containing sensor histidine kinase [Xanthomonadales bacterium]|nr:PAS domain-containing sensor histidine kinase [Xanthomonadales bacterium]
MRLLPGIDKEPGRKPQLSYESAILLSALAILLPPLVVALLLVGWSGAREHWLMLLIPAVLVSLLLALRLRARVVFPLYTLSNLLEALREGDYSLRGSRARRNDAIGEVIWEVNALSQTLREQRLRVEETMALLSKVVAEIDIAVFAFDVHRNLRLINPAGARLLCRHPREAEGRSAEELDLADCLAVEGAQTLRRSFPGGEGRFDVRRSTFREGGLPHELIVVTDLSRALREEERQAWQRLIRVLGHELNNSLAPIKSMAGTLRAMTAREPLPEDWRDDLATGLGLIEDRAEALTRFMLGYTTLARLPPPAKRDTDIGALLQRVAQLQQGIRVHCDCDAVRDVSVGIDPDQIEQALINLLKNAAEAMQQRGDAQLVARLEQDGSGSGARFLVIEIIDSGPGLAATDNLFVPFFTTKPGGSGIGLVLARQIAEGHGGSLTLENRRDAKGCVARLVVGV